MTSMHEGGAVYVVKRVYVSLRVVNGWDLELLDMITEKTLEHCIKEHYVGKIEDHLQFCS
jgi:hypothetical protein